MSYQSLLRNLNVQPNFFAFVALVPLPLTKSLKLSNSHKNTLDTFEVFVVSHLHLLLPKISICTAPSDTNDVM